MKAFLIAMLALVAISVGASEALKMVGFSSAEQASGNAVRLGD